MIKLNNEFLIEIGLGSLPPAEKNKMLNHIYETLEGRVGMHLAERMSEQQLTEFEGYIKRQDQQGALQWLESNFPDYRQVVSDELEKLKSEIKQVAPKIVAQSQQNAQATQNDATINSGQSQPQQPQQYQQAQPQGAAIPNNANYPDPNQGLTAQQPPQMPQPQQYQPPQPQQQPAYPPQQNPLQSNPSVENNYPQSPPPETPTNQQTPSDQLFSNNQGAGPSTPATPTYQGTTHVAHSQPPLEDYPQQGQAIGTTQQAEQPAQQQESPENTQPYSDPQQSPPPPKWQPPSK